MICLSSKRTSLLLKLRSMLAQNGATDKEVTQWMVQHASKMHNGQLRRVTRKL